MTAISWIWILALAAPTFVQDGDAIQPRLDAASEEGKAILDASALPAPFTLKIDRLDTMKEVDGKIEELRLRP